MLSSLLKYMYMYLCRLFKEICERSTSDIIEFSSDGTWKSFSNKSELLVHVEYFYPP